MDACAVEDANAFFEQELQADPVPEQFGDELPAGHPEVTRVDNRDRADAGDILVLPEQKFDDTSHDVRIRRVRLVAGLDAAQPSEPGGRIPCGDPAGHGLVRADKEELSYGPIELGYAEGKRRQGHNSTNSLGPRWRPSLIDGSLLFEIVYIIQLIAVFINNYSPRSTI